MENDRRFDFACRMGLLAAAILHWVVAGLMLWNRAAPASTWEYSRPARRYLASIVLELGQRLASG